MSTATPRNQTHSHWTIHADPNLPVRNPQHRQNNIVANSDGLPAGRRLSEHGESFHVVGKSFELDRERIRTYSLNARSDF